MGTGARESRIGARLAEMSAPPSHPVAASARCEIGGATPPVRRPRQLTLFNKHQHARTAL